MERDKDSWEKFSTFRTSDIEGKLKLETELCCICRYLNNLKLQKIRPDGKLCENCPNDP